MNNHSVDINDIISSVCTSEMAKVVVQPNLRGGGVRTIKQVIKKKTVVKATDQGLFHQVFPTCSLIANSTTLDMEAGLSELSDKELELMKLDLKQSRSKNEAKIQKICERLRAYKILEEAENKIVATKEAFVELIASTVADKHLNENGSIDLEQLRDMTINAIAKKQISASHGASVPSDVAMGK